MITISIAILVVAGAGAGASGLTAKKQLQDKLLTLSDVPAGWFVITPLAVHNPAECSRYFAAPKDSPTVTVTFSASQGVIEEDLANGPSVASLYRSIVQHFALCRSVAFVVSGTKFSGTGNAMTFPKVGSQSKAFSFKLESGKSAIQSDVVVFEEGRYVAAVFGIAADVPELKAASDLAASKL